MCTDTIVGNVDADDGWTFVTPDACPDAAVPDAAADDDASDVGRVVDVPFLCYVYLCAQCRRFALLWRVHNIDNLRLNREIWTDKWTV